MARRNTIASIIGLSLFLGSAHPALAQLTAGAMETLRQDARSRGWTFRVGPNPATTRSLDQLCGLKPPTGRPDKPPLARSAGSTPLLALPTSFDWRTLGGCTPVRDQGDCGGCWSFATIGAVESALLIKDGLQTDLSEQWLISCNTYSYGCTGGWFAFDFFQSTPDKCGQVGAVLESAFPYVAANVPCTCAAHSYRIDSWSEVDPYVDVPSVTAIKQAILTYGPVAVAVSVDDAFTAYTGGVFNASYGGTVNHGVVLVGWDDNQGTAGVWILRNSWGPGWGESGYMRIAYGCSSVGFGATYVQYAGTRLVTSVDSISVPEGGTATLQVRLAAVPSANVTVSVFRASGDSSITISGGSSLTFTAANWNVNQPVTLAAAQDADALDGQATIRFSAPGYQSRDVIATESDDEPLAVITDKPAITVPEGGSAVLQVKLSDPPAGDVVVSCTRLSGDSDLSVASGGTLTFTAANWNTYQPVTIAATEDADALNTPAVFRLAGPGLPSLDVTATEQENDVLSIEAGAISVTVPEGSTASFQVRLTADPGPSGLTMTVAHTAGDTDIRIQSGQSLAFTTANWNTFQPVTLQADPDPDVVNGQAVIRCSLPGIATRSLLATEQDSTAPIIDVDQTALTLPEGSTASFNVRLGFPPAGNVTVSVSNAQGDPDLSVTSGATLLFTPADWNIYQQVTISAARDVDVANGQATIRCSAPGLLDKDVAVAEQDPDTLTIICDPARVTVPEEATATFKVRLSAQPIGNVTVSVARFDGDPDINVISSPTLVFTPLSWNIDQAVALKAVKDADTDDGTTTIRCTATGLPSVDITANEQDLHVLSEQPPLPDSNPALTPPAAPACGAGASATTLACCALALLARRRTPQSSRSTDRAD